MSTFAQLCALPVPGWGVLVDVSTDYFVTTLEVSGVAQKWATATGRYNNPSNNFYLGNIAAVGRHQRALTADGTMAASTISLVLDNTDGALDWLTAPSTVASTVFKARFRVYVVAFDPSNPTDNQVQLLGTFQPLDMPTRDESKVTLELVDDALGDASELSLSPSLRSWLDHASTTSSNTPWAASPGVFAAGCGPALDETRPLPLAFGSRHIPLRQLVHVDQRYCPFVLCCTTDIGVPATTPESALVQIRCENPAFPIIPLNAGLCFLDRSPFTITRDGRDWRIWLVQFDMVGILNSAWAMTTVLAGEFGAPGSNGTAPGFRRAVFDAFFAKLGQLRAQAYPLSAHTYGTHPTGYDGANNPAWMPTITCLNIARDLINEYARPGAAADATSFDSVNAANPNSTGSVYVGEVGGRSMNRREAVSVSEGGQIRALLRGLCQAGMFDLTVFSGGQVGAVAATATYADYYAAGNLTALRIEETRVVADSVRVRVPSQGQRWAPYNRVFVEVGEGFESINPGRHGPFDHQPNFTDWGRPLTKTIDITYSDVAEFIDRPLNDGNINSTNVQLVGFAKIEARFPVESKVRPVVSFRTGLEALALNIGDFFLMDITRGGNLSLLDTYEDAFWKVEELNLIFESGQVEVTAVWSSDILTEIPFLLDDETLITRTTSATCGDGDTASDDTFTLAGGGSDFAAEGVVAGDILVLQDANEAADEFDRNRGVRIIARTAADQLQLAEVINSGVTVSTWKILRGFTTYPSSGVNYPDGSRVYGKAADVKNAGNFSDAQLANQIREG